MAGVLGIASTLGFAFRRAKKILPAGLRRAVVLEHLAVAIELVSELQAPVPQVIREGGLPLLATLAGGIGGAHGIGALGVDRGGRSALRLRPGASQAGGRVALQGSEGDGVGRGASGGRGVLPGCALGGALGLPDGAPGDAAVGGVPRRGCSAGLAPAIARPPPAAAAAELGLLGGVHFPDQGGLLLPPGVPRRRRPRRRAASRRPAPFGCPRGQRQREGGDADVHGQVDLPIPGAGSGKGALADPCAALSAFLHEGGPVQHGQRIWLVVQYVLTFMECVPADDTRRVSFLAQVDKLRGMAARPEVAEVQHVIHMSN